APSASRSVGAVTTGGSCASALGALSAAAKLGFAFGDGSGSVFAVPRGRVGDVPRGLELHPLDRVPALPPSGCHESAAYTVRAKCRRALSIVEAPARQDSSHDRQCARLLPVLLARAERARKRRRSSACEPSFFTESETSASRKCRIQRSSSPPTRSCGSPRAVSAERTCTWYEERCRESPPEPSSVTRESASSRRSAAKSGTSAPGIASSFHPRSLAAPARSVAPAISPSATPRTP